MTCDGNGLNNVCVFGPTVQFEPFLGLSSEGTVLSTYMIWIDHELETLCTQLPDL